MRGSGIIRQTMGGRGWTEAKPRIARDRGFAKPPAPATLCIAIIFFFIPVLAGLPAFAFAVEIVGHRGASHDAPENTLASVNLAWQQNVDAAEIDIHLSKDGKIVVIHDDSTKRIGGKDQPVAKQTLEELKSLDVGKWKEAKFAGERIPTLEEVLATIPEGKRLFIEIKCGKEVVPVLERVLQASGKKAEQTPVIGFDYETMDAVKKRMPQLKVYWIVKLKQDKKTKQWQPELSTMIGKAKQAGVDGLDLGGLEIVDKAYVEKIKQVGLQLYCWTINDEAEARRLADLGFDGITTDRPGWLRERLSGTQVIQKLIDELDSEDFKTRENATRKLSEMGREVIGPVSRAATTGSLEVVARALTVLEKIYRSGDDETIDAVESALEQLSATPSQSVSGRADIVLVKCYPFRERRALAEIRKAGGVFMRVNQPNHKENVVTETAGLDYGGLVLHVGDAWKGGDEGLRHVKRLTRLQALRFVPNVSGVSREAIYTLATTMPALSVHERGAAKLGLTGHPSQAPRGCAIDQIEAGSPAEEAQLEQGDVITRFDDKPVNDFESLVEMIKTKKPGDKVTLEIQRQREAKPRTVTPILKGWQQ